MLPRQGGLDILNSRSTCLWLWMHTQNMGKDSCISSSPTSSFSIPPAPCTSFSFCTCGRGQSWACKLWPIFFFFSWLNIIRGMVFQELRTCQAVCQALSRHCLCYFYDNPIRKVLLLFYHEEAKIRRDYAIVQGQTAVGSEARIRIQAFLNWNPIFHSLPANVHDGIQEV